MYFLLFVITFLLIFSPFVTFFCHIWKKNWCLICKNSLLCLDKFIFTDFHKDSSKRKAILLFFLIIIILLTFISNTYNIYLSEKVSKPNYNFFQFLDFFKINYKDFLIPLDLLIFVSYISSFLINRISEMVFPLKDGIDLNSKEYNTIIRFGTFCTLIKNLKQDKIKETAQKIGEEFGEKLGIQNLNLNNEKNLKILEEKWNTTDAELAKFYKRIIINKIDSNEIRLEILEPFWNKDFHTNCSVNLEKYPSKSGKSPTNCLNILCAFNFHYIEGVLNKNKNFKSLSLKCLNYKDKNNRKCHLKDIDKKCLFIIKIKTSSK
jgi:hypothetical protein